MYDDSPNSSGYNVHRWYEVGAGRYTRVDPAGLLFGGVHPYLYANVSPVRFVDPRGLATCVLISGVKMAGLFGAEVFFGDHSSVFVTGPCSGDGSNCSSPSPLLYDPNGGYPQYFPDSGTSYILDENIDDWSLPDYFDYQCDAGSDVLELYCFDTTCCEEQEIRDQIGSGGSPALGCALSTTSAVTGVGPFGDLGSGATPAILRKAINKAIRDHHGGSITRVRCPTVKQ